MKKKSDLTTQHCVPCEGGILPMGDHLEEQYMADIPDWALDRSAIHRIHRNFSFDGFSQSIQFVNHVAELAEIEGHHPNICIYYNVVKLELYTHAIKGLSLNDFILATKIDGLFKKNFSK